MTKSFPQAAAVVQEISESVQKINGMEAEALVELILRSDSIFVAGGGRSGLMIRSFAMRLMQMGFKVNVVGETVTPAIGARDLLIIGSGSGETQSLAIMAKKAKSIGASVALVTIQPSSSIGQISDTIVQLTGATKDHHRDSPVTIQPMASLFEQTLLILLDAVILRLMDKKELHSQNMFGLHANLE